MRAAASPRGRTGALSDTGSAMLGPIEARFSGSSVRLAMFSATSVAASGPAIAPARVDAVGDLAILLRALEILRALLIVLAERVAPFTTDPAIGKRSTAPKIASLTALSSLPSLVAAESKSCKAKGLSPKRKPCSRYSLIRVSRNTS